MNEEMGGGEEREAAAENTEPVKTGEEQRVKPKERRLHLPSLLLGLAIPLVILAAVAFVRSTNPPKRAMIDSFNGWWLLYMDWPGYDEPGRRVGELMVENNAMAAYLDGDMSTAKITTAYTYENGLLDMDIADQPFSPVIESSNRVIFAPPNSWRWKLVRPDFDNGDIFETSDQWEWEEYELEVPSGQEGFNVSVTCELGTIEVSIVDRTGKTIQEAQTLTADSKNASFTTHIRREEGYTGSYQVKIRGFSAAGWYAWE